MLAKITAPKVDWFNPKAYFLMQMFLVPLLQAENWRFWCVMSCGSIF